MRSSWLFSIFLAWMAGALLRPTRTRRCANRVYSSVKDDPAAPGSASVSPMLTTRRVRYSGLYPRAFREKYKELRKDPSTLAKVLSKGSTPAGMHIPILLDKCLEHLGFNGNGTFPAGRPVMAVDCTLGYGGHSSEILRRLLDRCDGSKLLCLDRDCVESVKAEKRLRAIISEVVQAGASGTGTQTLPQEQAQAQAQAQAQSLQSTVRVANINFRLLKPYLLERGLLGRVSSLLCDLGLSSMQIDDAARGFSYKANGPLDMRMDPASNNVTALSLLQSVNSKDLERILRENSDEPYSRQIALELLGPEAGPLPATTIELSMRIRQCLQQRCGLAKVDLTKAILDGTVKRCMQAIRIEVNQEFSSLESLLQDLPDILAPGGRAVFLTFHSGEDRRVKKSFKANFKAGVYQTWSRDVERADAAERHDNSRSSCAKLRWCINK